MIERYARVIDNIDPDKLGKIQIRVIPELNEVEDASLPWANPVSTGIPGVSSGTGNHSVPNKDDIVRVLVSEDWQFYDYLPDTPSVEDWYPYSKFEEEFDNPNVDKPEYPEPTFKRTPDGTIIFHNRTTGDIGIQHSSGASVVINTEGQLFVKFVKTVEFMSDDEAMILTMDNEAGEFKLTGGKLVAEVDEYIIGDGSDNAALFTPLEKVLNELLQASVIAPSGPTSPLLDASKVPLATKLAPDVAKIKSTKLKLD